MPEIGAVLPGALDAVRFFGRVEEMGQFRGQARLLARGAGRSRILCGRPGSGKTELLRQWHGTLFREGEIFPFWFPVPTWSSDWGRIACDLVAAFAHQALAFKRRDPGLLGRVAPPGELAASLRSSWGSGGTLLAEVMGCLDACAPRPDAFTMATLVPHRFAALTGTPVLCMVDDAGNLAAARAGRAWPREALASLIAPAVFVVDEEPLVARIFGREAALLMTLERLAPLSVGAASRLARQLARTAGLELGEQAVAALAGESAGSPFYLGALVRTLAERPGTSPLDVARAAAFAVCNGELARYWVARFAAAIPDRRARATALEILTFCFHEGDGAPDTGRLAAQMLKSEADIESALAGLCRAGVIRVDCARIRVDDDPVLHDVVQALYRREFGRLAPSAVTALLAAEKARRAPADRRQRWRDDFRVSLGGLLESWAGQQVPAVLFDSGAFLARHGAADFEDDPPSLAAEHDLITLPTVVSVASGRLGAGVSFPATEVDALAWAFRADPGEPGADVAWVVRLLAGGVGGAEQVAGFDRDVAALQMAGELPPSRVVRWGVLEAPLDGEGLAAAARLRLGTSLWPQIQALARLLGTAPIAGPPTPVTGARPEIEVEMVIPRGADVELVAARALEQLAESLAIAEPSVAKLRAALVEACINAFEHGGPGDSRVRVVFLASGGQLTMKVENRGRPLTQLPARAVPGAGARGRGWGLTLIRDLVDEVRLEPREDGVSLVMVKRIGEEPRG